MPAQAAFAIPAIRGRIGDKIMSNPRVSFFPLCDLHHAPMRRLILEEMESESTQSFHQCERRDCSRIFRDRYGYSDFADGHFDAFRGSSRICPKCGATLYLAEVDHTRKIETWECTGEKCDYNQEDSSPASR